MIKKLIRNRKFHIIFFEGLGSFIVTFGFACAAFGIDKAPEISIAASYFLAICITGEITGGYINPLVTIGMYLDNRHKKLALYLLGQFLGSLAGALYAWILIGPNQPIYDENWQTLPTIKFFLNEFIGASFFTMSVMVTTNKYTSHALKSWQVYISMTVSLFMVRKLTSDTVINPIVGITLHLVAAISKNDASIFYKDIWPIVVPSMLGAILGAFVIRKVYEPLLLYIKYKDLAQQSISEYDSRIEQKQEES